MRTKLPALFLIGVFLPLIVVKLAAAPKVPNILLILADDLGYGDVSCYNPESKVPALRVDLLAAEGMRFTDAHSPATVCTPTRYSIQTGCMSFRTGKHVVFTGAGGPCLIEAGRLTLPQMLREQGYVTAMFGKWHIGLTFLDKQGKPILDNSPEAVKRIDFTRRIPDSPLRFGYDHFFGTACCPTTDWLYAYIDGDRIPVPPIGPVDRSKFPRNPYTKDFRDGLIAPDFEVENVDKLFLEKSLGFLEKHAREAKEKPFFLFHSMQAIHLPSIPAEEFRGKTKAGPHGDFINQFDTMVGSLLDKLETLGLAESTLVILTSDNGPEVTSVVNMRKDYQHDGARPWRGVKRDQWEGGHRVPLIVRWPEKIKAGSVASQTVSLTDIMATCAALTGAILPDNAAEDSFDLSRILFGGPEPVRPYILQQTWQHKLSIRQGKWKFIDHQGSGGNDYHKWQGLDAYILPDTDPKAPGQLYDLEADRGETTNLYSKHPEIVKRLKGMLDNSVASGRSAPRRVVEAKLE